MIEDVSKSCTEVDDPDAVPAGSVRSAVRFLCDYSNALSSRGNVEEARKSAQDAWSLISDDTPGEKALVLCQFGILNARSRLYDDAERAFLDAIAIYSRFGPVKREIEAKRVARRPVCTDGATGGSPGAVWAHFRTLRAFR